MNLFNFRIIRVMKIILKYPFPLQLGFKEAHRVCWTEKSRGNMLHELLTTNFVLHQ